jgi:PiT family inorganic phosphate transporter
MLEDHEGEDRERMASFLERFREASVQEMEAMVKHAKREKEELPFSKKERKRLKKIYQEELVKRSQLIRIAAAWIITVPASACMAALLFFTLRGLLL